MPDQTLFLTLRIFSATGGIEKVSRAAGKALYEISNEQQGAIFKVFSMYDGPGDLDEKYFPRKTFKGFGKNKFHFMYQAIRNGIGSKLVVISHINLLLAGYLVKLFSPHTKFVLLAHGIEVWGPLTGFKKMMLNKCDQVLTVSQFTKDKMIAVHGIDAQKCTVLNNCLDPYLPPPHELKKNTGLMERYGLGANDIVLITLTRLSSREQYKGYDNMLYAIKELKQQYPTIKYLIIGKYDEPEKQRVQSIIEKLQLQQQVIIPGFIPEDELGAHYSIADMYVMPSKKEGFGIVFIEAMYYGKPVIAGNKDGSVDALDNGKFGQLVNPDDRQEITAAITRIIDNKEASIPLQAKVLEKFSYPVYKENLRKILNCIVA